MKRSPHLAAGWRHATRGAALCAAIGLLFDWVPLGDSLALRSYDLPLALRGVIQPDEAVIVYLDEEGYLQLGQGPRDFDRRFHAGLIRYLAEAKAKLVVFDFWFSQADSNRPGSDAALAQAIREHGKVVLAGGFTKESSFGLLSSRRLPPWEGFRTNAAGWGVPLVSRDLESTVRRYEWKEHSAFALPWVAATRIKPGLTNLEAYVQSDPWLNYYGPRDTISHVSYVDVTNRPSGFFKDRCVFVGSRPATLFARDHHDQFGTPYTPWRYQYSTGVEIVATAFLNLIRDEALHRLDLLGVVDRQKGKFRSFLLVVVRRFLSGERDRERALKRGGGQQILSLDAEDAENRYASELASDLSPDKAYEMAWFRTLLGQVLGRLKEESVAAGKGALFDRLKGFLEEDCRPGTYNALAAEIGMTPNALAVAAFRLNT